MDMNLFKKSLASKQKILSEATQVVDKTNTTGHNGSAAYITLKNQKAESRSIWLPDASDIAHYGKSALKKVYRWYYNENPNNGINGGSSLIKVDIHAGQVYFLNLNYDNDSTLVWESRPNMLEKITIFDKKVLDNQ
jgi:hypothetical protein